MIHCHRLNHEDLGMMAMEDVLDPAIDPDAKCQCEANVARAPSEPTPSPTSTPSLSSEPSATPSVSNEPSESNQPTKVYKRPNFIVMQPDDLNFYGSWTPPPHYPDRNDVAMPAEYFLKNMDRLRSEGLQMMQAYTAS